MILNRSWSSVVTYIYIVASFYFISTAFNGGSVAHIFNRFGSSLLSCACRQGYKVVTKPFLKHVIFSVDMCSLQLGFPAGQLEITAKRKDSLRNHAACEALKKGGNFALSLSLSPGYPILGQPNIAGRRKINIRSMGDISSNGRCSYCQVSLLECIIQFQPMSFSRLS